MISAALPHFVTFSELLVQIFVNGAVRFSQKWVQAQAKLDFSLNSYAEQLQKSVLSTKQLDPESGGFGT